EVRRRGVRVWNDQGVAIKFPKISTGEEKLGPFGWLLRRDATGFSLDVDDGVIRRFGEPHGTEYPLSLVEDRNGNRIALHHEGGALRLVTDGAGRKLAIDLTPDGRIAVVRAPHPTVPGDRLDMIRYRYDDVGNLVEATDADGFSARYAYDA